MRSSTSFGYGYDAVGNRISKTAGSATDTYTYSTTSNRIASVAGATSRSFAFDENGSTVGDGTNEYAYDARGRMVQSSNTTSGATAYQVNALGQRIRKTNSSEDRIFLYDTRGRLIGESTPSGVPLREYLWLNDQPLAVAVSPTSGTQCPATPTRDRSGTFIPFDVRERIEAKAGRPGPRGWEWALGPSIGTAGGFVQTDVDWVSGKLYGYRLVYEAGGSASLEVRDGAAVVASARWNGAAPMRSGNAVRLLLRIDDQGPDSRAVLTIDTVDGQAIGERIVVRGSDTRAPDAERRIYSGDSLKDGFTIEGTLRLVYPARTTPIRREFDLRVTAGNVECATTVQTTAALYYVHTDHLNTPRFVADGNGTTVWRWDQQEPFGATPPNDDPDGDGVKFEFSLRFPGQYADRETGLAYNYFRDYDPAIGRYAKSDPIGLGGGMMNTYGYVWQSPLMFFDSFGLECWWLDLGNAEKCELTGLRRQKPTQTYQSKEWFPAPDPTSPSLTIAPIPPMPEPGWKLVWRTVFKEKGYWEAEFECKVWATYVCRDCGKITFYPGNKPLGKKWEKEADSDYDEVTRYGSWSNVNPPTGPYDLDVGGGRRPGPRPSPRLPR